MHLLISDMCGWFAGGGPILVRGVALGLGAAIPIGPVNVQIARRVLRGGFFAGLVLGLGAVTADVTYAVLTGISFVRLLDWPIVAQVISLAGALLLTYLGFGCLRAALRDWKSDPITSDRAASPTASRSDIRRGYTTGLLMTLLNPMTLAFWFAVVPAATGPAGPAPARADSGPPAQLHWGSGPALEGATPAGGPKRMKGPASNVPITCAGVFIGTIAWVVTFCGLLAWAGRSRRNGWIAVADAIGGVTLLIFAGTAFWRLCRSQV